MSLPTLVVGRKLFSLEDFLDSIVREVIKEDGWLGIILSSHSELREHYYTEKFDGIILLYISLDDFWRNIIFKTYIATEAEPRKIVLFTFFEIS